MIQPLSAIKSLRLEYPHLKVAYLIPLADIHIGSPLFRREALQGYVEWIGSRPNAYSIGVGDWCQNNIVGNRASDVFEQAIRPSEQPIELERMLDPIRDRFWGAVGGGHDLRGQKATDTDRMAEAAERLGFGDRYSAAGLFITVVVGDVEYKLYAVHGWGGARTAGGQVNKIEELAKVTEADVYMCGHEHTMTYSRSEHRYFEDGQEKNRRQHFVGCGCFEDYTGFLVNISRKAPNIGSPRVRFDGTRRDIHVSF